MELRNVETFLAVAKELHFGRAARRLGVTQSWVSQTIRALENEVGAALFERTSRRVRLTAVGERFRDGAQCGYDELTRTLHDCQTAARNVGERLRVSYLPTIGGGCLARMVSVFAARHPRCEVQLNAIVIRETVSPAELLEEEATDVALVWSPGGDGRALRKPGLTIGPALAEEPRGLLAPAGHPLARRQSVSLDDLCDDDLLRLPDTVDAVLRDLWTPRATPSGRPLRHTSQDLCRMTGRPELPVEDVMSLVAGGRGLHLTVASLLARVPFAGLTVVPVRDMPPMALVPVWSTAAENATIRAFVRCANVARPDVLPISRVASG